MPSDFTATPPYNVSQPGAYSDVNASQVSETSQGIGQPIPVILGTALGGIPDSYYEFESAAVLQQILRGGPGYDTARFAFDGGAPAVGFVRVGNSVTQGTLNLAGSGGTVISLTSQDYGSWVNSIQVTVATGPIVTLQYTDALGNTYTEVWNFTGVSGLTPAMIASAINGGLYGYTASNYVTATVGAGALPLTTVSAQSLSGGTDGTSPAAGDWTNGLSVLETQLIDIVVPATSDPTVHAQALVHCQNMSQPNARHERVLVCGGALGDSVSATITRMASLRSARAELVYPGLYDYNAAGNLTEYDSFYMAGKIAGMWCAQPDVATSLVHEAVPVQDLEVYLSTVQGGALDQLLAAGVTPIARQPGGGFWVVDALTGYNLPDQTFHDMISTRSADYTAQYLRLNLEQMFVGGKNLVSTQSSLTSAAAKFADDLVTATIIEARGTPTVTAGPRKGSWNVGVPVQLVTTDKFIFINVGLQASVTVSGSTTTADTQG